MTDSPKTFLKNDLLRKILQFDKIIGLAIKGFSEEIGQKSKNFLEQTLFRILLILFLKRSLYSFETFQIFQNLKLGFERPRVKRPL